MAVDAEPPGARRGSEVIVAGRPDVRGGRPTRGFPPGSAQALVALVLGLVAGVTGVRRDELVPAALFFLVALLGAVGLWRLLRQPRSRG